MQQGPPDSSSYPGGNPGANLKSITHRCHLFEVAFVWELTKYTIHLPLGCLQGGETSRGGPLGSRRATFPPWRQPRGKSMVSLVNYHTNATRIGWHLWEIDLRFAPGLPSGRLHPANDSKRAGRRKPPAVLGSRGNCRARLASPPAAATCPASTCTPLKFTP